MLLGPVFTYELITTARRTRYFILRVAYAVILFSLLWVTYSSASNYQGEMSWQEIANFTNAFFATFANAQLVAVVLLTPAMVAGTLAQERERRTIEYLLASQLTNVEIVLSKFAARLLTVALMLASGLPVLALAMLMGGIGPELLAQVFALLFLSLIAAGALSIGVSVWRKRSRDAVMSTYLFLLVFLIVPLVLWSLPFASISRVGGALSSVNPFAVLWQLWNWDRPVGVGSSGWSVVGRVALYYSAFTAVTLTWSVLAVRRVYRKSVGAGTSGKKSRFAWRLWRPALGERAMLWKELFARSSGQRLGWIARIAATLLVLAALSPAVSGLFDYLRYGGGQLGDFFQFVIPLMTSAVLLMLVALLAVLIRAASGVTAEREQDCWISLISTPLTGSEIVWAKLAGSVYAARWILGLVLAVYGLGALVVPTFVFVAPILVALDAIIIWYAAALGTHFSLWCHGTIRAMGGAVATAVFFGGGYLLCCIPVFALGPGDEAFVMLAPCIPFLISSPSAFLQVFEPGRRGIDDELGMLIVTLLLGGLGYLVAAIVLTSSCIANFDGLAGRLNRGIPTVAPPRKETPEEAILLPESPEGS